MLYVQVEAWVLESIRDASIVARLSAILFSLCSMHPISMCLRRPLLASSTKTLLNNYNGCGFSFLKLGSKNNTEKNY
jgi:hypothetical protein